MKKVYLTVLLFLCSPSVVALEITGMFSSFSVGESGDISGVEIHIKPNPIGYSAIVQGSEGAPAFPIVVNLPVNKNQVSFEIPKSSGCGLQPGKYIGIISKKSITLEGPQFYDIPRAVSFWK